MTRRAMTLMDVLAPPGNDWLRELSRRNADLPVGVRIVRFGNIDDDLSDDDEGIGMKALHRKQVAA